MAGGVAFTVDTLEISRLSQGLARMMGQYEWITARAMTDGAKSAREAIRREILPRIEGGPSNWTKRGLIVKYASRNDFTAMAGFQYGEGKWTDSEFSRKGQGIPAGRYMGVNARGGDRKPKATERALRRVGAIQNDQFITPNARGRGVRIDARGNVSGGAYQQLLSRLRALPEGSSQNAPRGRGGDSRGRSASSRAATDYFVLRRAGDRPSRWELGANPSAIVARAGRGPKGGTGKGSGQRGRPQTVGFKRGFRTAFNITDQPNYERRFPIESVAMREFRRVFPQAWQAGLQRELARRASR